MLNKESMRDMMKLPLGNILNLMTIIAGLKRKDAHQTTSGRGMLITPTGLMGGGVRGGGAFIGKIAQNLVSKCATSLTLA